MPMPGQPEQGTARRRMEVSLSLLWGSAPTLWLSMLSLLYATSDRHCERGSGALWGMWGASTLVVLGLTLRAGLLARRQAGVTPAATPHAQATRFMSLGALALNLLCLVLMLGLASPLIALRPCQ